MRNSLKGTDAIFDELKDNRIRRLESKLAEKE
jgi:hypothetical protein